MPGTTSLPTRLLLRSAAIGLATGMRSQMGIAAVLNRHAAMPGVLGRNYVRRAALVSAGGEVVADKLPFVPDRRKPPSLVARIVLGGLSAALLTSGTDAPALPSFLVGASAGAVSTYVFHALRARAAKVVPDPLAATAEDALALLLVAAATAPLGRGLR